MSLSLSIVGTLCYVRGTPFFLFFFFCFCFTPVLLLKNISAIMKNFSAIKRVVKHENMAIYVRYPLYSWKHLFNEQFFRFFEKFSAIKRVVKHENMAIYVRYPLYSWKHNFEELYAPYPILVGTLCYVQGTPFFLFFFLPQFYC